MSPHVRAVVRDVDRNVAHNLDPATMATISEFLPLPEELELRKLVNHDVGGQSDLPFLENGGVPLAYSSIPMNPGYVFVNGLACHEEGVVVQPSAVFLAKRIESEPVRMGAVLNKSLRGFAKQVLLEVEHPFVFDLLLRKVRRVG